MEFKDIKNTWNNSFMGNELLNKDEIEAKLKIKGKSNTALNKVRRNYKIELILGSIMSVYFIVWISFNLSNKYKFILIALSIIFFGTLISFTWRNFQKIRKTVLSNEQLKPALNKTIKDIERYVNFNKSNFTKFLLLPFAIVFGMFIGIFMGMGEKEISEILLILEGDIVKMVIIIIVLSSVFIPISQYFNKKMYKQHLDELKECLKEFEDYKDNDQ